MLREYLKQGTTALSPWSAAQGGERKNYSFLTPTRGGVSAAHHRRSSTINTHNKREMNQLVSEVAAMKKSHDDVLQKYKLLVGLVKQLRLKLEAYEKNNSTTTTMGRQDNEPTLELNLEDLNGNRLSSTDMKSSTAVPANTLAEQLVKSRDEIIEKSTKEAQYLRRKVRSLGRNLEKATECISSQKIEIQRYAQMVSELEHNISMQALESEERLVKERKASTKIINDLIVNLEENTDVAEVLQNTRAALATITSEHRVKLDELDRKTNEQALSEEEIIHLKHKVQNLKEDKEKFLQQIKMNDLEIDENRRMLSNALRILDFTNEFKTDLSMMKDELRRINTTTNVAVLSSSHLTPRKEEAVAVATPNLAPFKGIDKSADEKRANPALKEEGSTPPCCTNETMKQILSPILKTLSLLSSDDLYSTTTKQLCELTMTALQQEYSCRSIKPMEREGVINTEGYGHRWKDNSTYHSSYAPKETPHGLQKLRERLRAAQLRLLTLKDDSS